MRSLPNLITLLRILLILPFLWYMAHRGYGAALLIFALAGISDGLDGFLAKRFGWTSELGAILDPLADKLLLVSTFVSLWWLAALPGWLVVAVLLRDLIIVGGALAYYRLFGRYEMAPLPVSKVNTVCQLTLALAAVLALGYGVVPLWLLLWLVALATLTTIVSGVAYVWIWSRRALAQRRAG